MYAMFMVVMMIMFIGIETQDIWVVIELWDVGF
jgi:hypothetical protein